MSRLGPAHPDYGKEPGCLAVLVMFLWAMFVVYLVLGFLICLNGDIYIGQILIWPWRWE